MRERYDNYHVAILNLDLKTKRGRKEFYTIFTYPMQANHIRKGLDKTGNNISGCLIRPSTNLLNIFLFFHCDFMAEHPI
jgi:hypothetical protein